MEVKKIKDVSKVAFYNSQSDDISYFIYYFAYNYKGSSYFLDKDNAIVVETKNGEECRMVHLRIVDGWLSEINSLYLPENSKCVCYKDDELEKLGLPYCLIGNGQNGNLAIYDYKKAEFVVTPGTWDYINKYDVYIKGREGFMAGFRLWAYTKESELLKYKDIFLGYQTNYPFTSDVENYFAVLNYDGTIRGDKLFKGDDMGHVTEIIDLAQYGSVENFKKQRFQILEEQRQAKIRQYKEFIATRTNGDISPFLDSEVFDIVSNVGSGTIKK